MNAELRILLTAATAALFCIGFATELDWRAMLALKLVPVALALDWLRAQGEPGRYRRWITVGLAWSVLGDALLAPPEDRFLGLLWDLHGAGSPERAVALTRSAARELLLLQASDWNFVITTGGAVDYGYARFCGHLTRFDRLATMAHDVMHGRGVTPLQDLEAAEADAHDTCFASLPLHAWDDRLRG